MTPKKTIRISAAPEPPPQPSYRIKPKAGMPERATAPSRIPEPPRRRVPRVEEQGSGAGLKIGIAVAVIVVVVIVAVVAASSGGRSRRPAPVQVVAPVSTAPAKKAGSVRYDELGGKTMEEWCKENDRKNPDLQARKQRVGGHERGRQTAK